MMRILGIDPGLANTGYGIIDHDGNSSKMVLAGCVVTASDTPLSLRLQKIHNDLVEIVKEWQPTVAAMEELFFCTNVKTAISVAQGRGVAILATSGLELAEYTPLEIKQAVVGYGKATKPQVQRMVRTLLALREGPHPHHAADALAVALCHAHSYKFLNLAKAAGLKR